MIRRLKADVLTELPPKRRQVVEIAANGASAIVARERKGYEAHEERIESLRASAELAKAESNEAYAAAVAALSEAQQAAFGEISQLRHDTAVAKVPAILEHVTSALEADESSKVIVFAHHHDVIDALVTGLGEYGAVHLDGRMGMTDRQANVDRFQTDPGCRVFVGGILAAGVGLTLTASSHVIFAELDWVPGNVTQAEDRAHRIGQTQSVLVQHLVLDGSLDARMAHILVEKQDVADRALDRATSSAAYVTASRERAATETESRKKLAAVAEKLTDEQIAEIHAGLRRLRAACDGARNLDGQGFSAIDVRIGWALADAPKLTRRQAALGLKLTTKYRRQLAA
jgi:SWI/SNF-related matrix-associated actin-dependent regulator 1 of chromatin subfamily A